MLGVGPPDAIGVLIGEGPGYDEVTEGAPFVGSTGRELDESLKRGGMGRGKLFVLNTTCCRPGEVRNERKMQAAADACRPAFEAQFRKVKPGTPVLAMGKWAAYAATGIPTGVMSTRGFYRPQHQLLGRLHPLMVTWTPSYAIFGNPYEWGTFDIDVDRFARLIKGKLEPLPGEKELRIYPKVSDIESVWNPVYWKAWGLNEPTVAVDVETLPHPTLGGHTGRFPTLARLRTMGLGNPEWGLSFMWGDEPQLEKATKKLLADPRVLKVFHNGPLFDHQVCRRYGLEINNWEDTRDLQRAQVSTRPLALRAIGSIHCDYIPWKNLEEEEK